MSFFLAFRIHRGLVTALTVLFVTGSAGVGAAQSIPEQDLDEARNLYREARFAEAIVKLQQLVERLGPLRDVPVRKLQLADAYQYLGLSQLALNDLPSARESLKGMVRLDRERRLDPDVYAPKVIELFEEARAAVAVEPAPRLAQSPAPAASANRRSRTPLVILGVGAAAAAAALGIQRVAGSNKPPSAGAITVSPPSAGMAALTTYTFRATGASDPDGDRLTYNWEFGDGGSGSGEVATHVYANAGSYSVTLKVSDGKLQASASGSLAVNRTMAGTWSGRHSRIGNPITINFTQSGSTLGGTMTLEPVTGGLGSTRPLTGSISGSNNFVCPCEVSFVATGFGTLPLERGEVDATVNLLTGPGNVELTGSGILSGVWTLTRR